MKAIIVILLAILACASAQQIWTNCGAPSDTLTITNLALVPSPPVIGSTLVVTLNGTLTKTITDGHIAVLVFYNGIQLFSQTFDICTAFSGVFKCPVSAGKVNIRVAQQIPAFAPPGEYSGQLSIHDESGAEVVCIKYDFNMGTSVEQVASATLMATDDRLIAEINNDPTSTWVAGRNAKFEGMTLEQAKSLLGTNLASFKNIKKVVSHAAAVPSSFDSRQHWPNCIHAIRNQEKCGSCWAFGATEALSDRFCIASNGKVNVVLSPQYLVSCDSTDMGCGGGYLENAWRFMEEHGVVKDSCFPYASASGVAPGCISRCVDGEAMTYYKVKKGSIQQPYDIPSIQNLIMSSGPVEAAFSVYQDFFAYKSGVYVHKTGALAGGHAIKIIGWGVDSQTNQPYWIVANSWGTTWGQQGFFWILRGSDECGIESNVVAGLPAL